MAKGEKIKIISAKAKEIRKADEKWLAAIKRATLLLKKEGKI